MKNKQTHLLLSLLGVCVLCLTATPAKAQKISLDQAVTRNVMAQRITHATQTLREIVSDMACAQTEQDRDNILRAAKNMLDQDANVRAHFSFRDKEDMTLLELIVNMGVQFNANHFANLYNLAVSYGANPVEDLRAPFNQWVNRLPLKESTAWQKIAEEPADQPVAAKKKPFTYGIAHTVTIHIPEAYNTYSCRKLKKMEKKGTLPQARMEYADAQPTPLYEQESPVLVGQPTAKSITIVIPEEYNTKSCKQLSKMEKKGTLPKAKVIYNND